MKYFKFCIIFLVLITINNCSSLSLGTQDMEKPDTDLYKTLEDLLKKNGYLVFSYKTSNIIDDYTYELQMETSKYINLWSWTGTSEEMNCMVVVKNEKEEVIAQIYSSDNKDKATMISNGFRGGKNMKVLFLDRPSRKILIESYNNMMNGIE